MPRKLQDKWFIYWEGGILCFHRSWLDTCFFIAIFEVYSAGATIASLRACREKEQYPFSSDEADMYYVRQLIRYILL